VNGYERWRGCSPAVPLTPPGRGSFVWLPGPHRGHLWAASRTQNRPPVQRTASGCPSPRPRRRGHRHPPAGRPGPARLRRAGRGVLPEFAAGGRAGSPSTAAHHQRVDKLAPIAPNGAALLDTSRGAATAAHTPTTSPGARPTTPSRSAGWSPVGQGADRLGMAELVRTESAGRSASTACTSAAPTGHDRIATPVGSSDRCRHLSLASGSRRSGRAPAAPGWSRCSSPGARDFQPPDFRILDTEMPAPTACSAPSLGDSVRRAGHDGVRRRGCSAAPRSETQPGAHPRSGSLPGHSDVLRLATTRRSCPRVAAPRVRHFGYAVPAPGAIRVRDVGLLREQPDLPVGHAMVDLALTRLSRLAVPPCALEAGQRAAPPLPGRMSTRQGPFRWLRGFWIRPIIFRAGVGLHRRRSTHCQTPGWARHQTGRTDPIASPPPHRSTTAAHTTASVPPRRRPHRTVISVLAGCSCCSTPRSSCCGCRPSSRPPFISVSRTHRAVMGTLLLVSLVVYAIPHLVFAPC